MASTWFLEVAGILSMLVLGLLMTWTAMVVVSHAIWAVMCLVKPELKEAWRKHG